MIHSPFFIDYTRKVKTPGEYNKIVHIVNFFEKNFGSFKIYFCYFLDHLDGNERRWFRLKQFVYFDTTS